MSESELPEPWLRGTLTTVPAVQRAVLHALELAGEDLRCWCARLTHHQFNARVFGLAPVAFHVRHVSRSIDRLLTYAEGHGLSDEQTSALKTELIEDASPEDVLAELRTSLSEAALRVKRFDPASLEQTVAVGKKKLPTTVGGLLVHVAEHTQRHVGQAITTAKIALKCDV